MQLQWHNYFNYSKRVFHGNRSHCESTKANIRNWYASKNQEEVSVIREVSLFVCSSLSAMAAVYQLDYDLGRVQVLNAIPFAFPVMRARREHFRKEAVQRMFRTPSSNNAISVSKWRNCCNYSSQPSYFTRNGTKMSRSACVTSHCCQENLELLREKMFSQSVSSSCFVFFINIKLNKNLNRLFLIFKTLIFKRFRIQFLCSLCFDIFI